jgi:class 3 adenylate cyclase/tetratricopeptide (TPR) repeat protein
MQVCPNCREENPDRARFCLACGSPLPAAQAAEPAAEERKVVTAVFVDLVGFTSRSEKLDPEAVWAVQTPYHATLRRELERHGGTVEKFIGDAVFALFGAPVTREDDAERAIRAALSIREAIADLNRENPALDLHIRIGINTGEALVALGARPSEGEGMASGDVINTANRLESAAPHDGILVGEATYRSAARAFSFRAAEPVHAKGKTEPVAAWEVVGPRDDAARPAPAAPLVGRDLELHALEGLWNTALRDRRATLATVLGAPGIGKSRLVAELTRRLDDDASVHWGRCLAYGEGITYWAIVEIVKDAAGIAVSDDQAAVSVKLGALLERLPTDDPDELRMVAAALSNLLGAQATPRGTYAAAGITRNELHWGIRRLFELLATERPLALVFEDLHWAEPTLLELVAFLAETTGPILLLATARRELADSGPAILEPHPRRLVIELEALTESDSERLLAGLLGGEAPPAGALEALRNAGGNPLYLEETVRMLADRGLLTAEAPELTSVPVPTSLQSLIGSRLDRLTGDEKQVAGRAAVVGHTFWSGAVAHLDGGLEVGSRLEELARRDLVQPHALSNVAGELEWAFKHMLIRDVAYARLPKRRRTALHAKCAEWISALPGGDERFIEIVAYHLEQACLVARDVGYAEAQPPIAAAVDALARAADKAERREGIREAERYYSRALEIATEGSPAGIELRLKHARTLATLGELERAAEGLREVERDADVAALADIRCRALLALVSIDRKQGRAAESRRHLAKADELAAASSDVRLQIQTAFELSQARAWFEPLGDRAVADLRRALALAADLDDRGLRIEGHMRLGMLLFNMGDLPGADEQLERCAQLAATLGSRRDEARAKYALGFVRYYHGRLDEAEKLALQAVDWLDRAGDSYFQLQNLRALAKYALARGDAVLAERRIRDGLPQAADRGGWLLVELFRLLAEALVRQGRLDEAREAALEARAALPEEDPYASAAALVAEAIIPGHGSMQERIEEAFHLLQEQHLLLDLEEARIDVARALKRAGDLLGARRELVRARDSLSRIDARGLLAEIDRELAEAEGDGVPGPIGFEPA